MYRACSRALDWNQNEQLRSGHVGPQEAFNTAARIDTDTVVPK